VKLHKLLSIATVVLFAAGIAHADGTGDGRLGTKPIPPTDPPPCASVQFTADGNGAISDGSAICGVTSNTTQITIIVPDTELGVLGVSGVPNLQVYSTLTQNVPQQLISLVLFLSGGQVNLSQFDWTSSCVAGSQSTTVGGVASQECTLTAPELPTGQAELAIIGQLTQAGIIDSAQGQGCTASIFFVATGCALDFTTDSLGNAPGLGGDVSGQFLSANAQIDSTNGSSAPANFPEPGSLTLLAAGLAGLPLLRRKFAR
jgi:hypothetical protein